MHELPDTAYQKLKGRANADNRLCMFRLLSHTDGIVVKYSYIQYIYIYIEFYL